MQSNYRGTQTCIMTSGPYHLTITRGDFLNLSTEHQNDIVRMLLAECEECPQRLSSLMDASNQLRQWQGEARTGTHDCGSRRDGPKQVPLSNAFCNVETPTRTKLSPTQQVYLALANSRDDASQDELIGLTARSCCRSPDFVRREVEKLP